MNSGSINSKDIEDLHITLLGGIRDMHEINGDFFCNLKDGNRICFEVYAPEEPLSLSTKKLKVETKEIRKVGGLWVSTMGGGLSPNRLNELVERALTVKQHQFSEKRVQFKKVLIIDLRRGEFTSLDNVGPVVERVTNTKYNPCCAAIYVIGSFAWTRITNEDARYPLNRGEIEFIDDKYSAALNPDLGTKP